MSLSVVAVCGRLVQEYRLPANATVDDLYLCLVDDKQVIAHCGGAPLQIMDSSRRHVLCDTDMLVQSTGQDRHGRLVVHFGVLVSVSFVVENRVFASVTITSACSVDEARALANVAHCSVKTVVVRRPIEPLAKHMHSRRPCYMLTVYCSE